MAHGPTRRVVEFAERFAYIGIASYLVIYLIHVLNVPDIIAVKIVSTWTGISVLFPLLGAFIADSYLGRFKTILISSLMYLLQNGWWSLGFGLVSGVLALSLAVFLLGIKKYRKEGPCGSPFTRLAQVFVAAARKWHVKDTPDNNNSYYEEMDYKEDPHNHAPKFHTLLHTNHYRFLDKAMIIDEVDEGSKTRDPWKLCSVTQVKEMKLVLRLIPIWVCCIMFTAVQAQGQDCGGNNIASTINVNQCGCEGAFPTIQKAIDSIKSNNDQWVKIHITAGTYTEEVKIPKDKPCIILEGEGIDKTIIEYDNHQQYKYWSPTFHSNPSNIIVLDITFKNTYNLGMPPVHEMTQALAVGIFGDKSVFYKCGFIGVQDTLFDSYGRHYFKSCYIQGQVDFIFGGGQSYYEDCMINATRSGYITAQARSSEDDPSGFIFKGGSVVGNENGVYLGRAYGPYSRVIFYGTNFSSVVAPQGWNAWSHVGHESNLTYAEVECEGPGNDTRERVPWTKNFNALELEQFSLSSFINKDSWMSNLPVILS